MSRLKEAFLGDTLYESRYPARPGWKATDTSREAAQSVVSEANRLQLSVLKALAERNLTADEIAVQIGATVLATRPRLTELKALGKIIATTERRRNESGRNAIVWRLA